MYVIVETVLEQTFFLKEEKKKTALWKSNFPLTFLLLHKLVLNGHFIYPEEISYSKPPPSCVEIYLLNFDVL